MDTVRIDAKAARRLREGHPWVFSNQVREVLGAPGDGEVVRVEAGPSQDLGTAFYNGHSHVALRHLSFEGEIPDELFFEKRLRTAVALRERLHPGSDSWRACHGEADLIPGLFVDRYGDCCVVQAFSAGIDRLLPVVARALQEVLGSASVVERDTSHVRALEGLPECTRVLMGETPASRVVTLPPLVLDVHPMGGQKTGAFLDQRENRVAAARHARGRDVYEAFCNAGAFGILAAREGARSVVGVDVSAEAVAEARRNASLNGVEGLCQHVQADATKDMDARHRRRERFGLVIIDPPSFTRSRKHVPQARRALRDLNRRAITLVEPGGVLVSSDCSHHVLEETFLDVLGEAALAAGRRLKVLELRSQSPDHPVLLAMPESRYLKCVIAQVV